MANLRVLCLVLSPVLLGGVVPAALAAKDPPAVTEDGLERRESKGGSVVYARPGVDFSVYKRVAILECPVSFRKDWERDHRSGTTRVSQKDMDEMKAWLSAEFLKVFTEELQDKGGYQVVTTGGEDVLVLRPAIVDLDVVAPDTMSAGRSYTLAEEAGAMTLYLEFYDSLTSQVIARAIDRETSRGSGRIQWQNSVTNKMEADKILRRWARALRARLDEVNGKST